MQRVSLITHTIDAEGVPDYELRTELSSSPGDVVGHWRQTPEESDVVIVPQPLSDSSVQLAVCDVDSTFIEQEVIELLAEYAGVRDEVAAITEAAMRGELDFEESLRARVATLKGLPATVLDEVAQRVILTPGAQAFVRGVHAAGGRMALVSGGFDRIVEQVAAPLGIDYVEANELEMAGGALTGRVRGAVVDRARKAQVLTELVERWDLDPQRTLAVGDGANDIDMVDAAGCGVAFCAKAALVDVADANVTVRRLDAVLAAVSGVRP